MSSQQDGMQHHGAEFDDLLDELKIDADRIYAGFEAMPAETYAQVVASAKAMDVEIKSKKQAAQFVAWAKKIAGFVTPFLG